jgi:hypothetical protein
LFPRGQSPPRVDEPEGNNRVARSAASNLFASATVTHAAPAADLAANLGQNLHILERLDAASEELLFAPCAAIHFQKLFGQCSALRSLRKLHSFSTLAAGKRYYPRKAWKQVHGSTMRAYCGGHIKCEFHFRERLLKVSGGHRANHRTAFIADYSGLFAANDAIQTAAAIWIAEI